MTPFDQSWFWTGVFALAAALVGSVLTLTGIVLRERLNRTTAINLERIKLHEAARFEAYKTLYEFVSSAYTHFWPPDDVEKDFESVMKELYYKHVKSCFPYFDQDVRAILKVLELWYQSLYATDVREHSQIVDQSPGQDKVPAFSGKAYLSILNQLNEVVERRFDLLVGK